jgi:hypothetical protein
VFVLALQILNLSVYGNAFVQRTTLKNGKIVLEENQIDSALEYVVEIMMKRADAFPEQKGNHTKNEQKTLKNSFQLFTCCQQQEESETIEIPEEADKYAVYRNDYRYLYFKEINPPPPKFS